jgi:hypothetical protein
LANAELFLDQAKASWWTAKARAVARGAHIGPTPIGYQRIPKGERDSGRLLPHPTYGPAMTELFDHAANNGSDGETALARWMTARAPRAGGAPWLPSEIRRWLSNRIYLGEKASAAWAPKRRSPRLPLGKDSDGECLQVVAAIPSRAVGP